MLSHRINSCLIAGVIFAGVAGIGHAAAQDFPKPPPGETPAEGASAGEQNYEAVTRGPLHEAFANPYADHPEAGLIVPKKPPEPIVELPPEAAPSGANVEWIPGYWGWDPDEQDFLWVSGLWRDVPPDRRWVPGYWNQVTNGYQWVAGFWAPAEERELSYLPTPPESLDQGPNVPAPDGDYFWSPGCWIWTGSDYQWRPGYWAAAQENWVWVPDHYNWSPYGCVFVSGYWDRDFIHRGTLFSSVRFARLTPGFRYVPRVTINPAALLVHLFVNPSYRHYYYGDYYAQNNSRFGLLPWIAYGGQANRYDPLLNYYQWNYGRRGVNLSSRLLAWNQYFVNNKQFRPPRTYDSQRQFATRFQGQNNVPVAQTVFATPLQKVLATDDGRQQFRSISENTRQQVAQSAEQFQRISQQRAQLESRQGRQESPNLPPGQNRNLERLERTLELPQRVTTLKPSPGAEQPATPDAADPRQPGRPGQTPPPLRPPRNPKQPQPGQPAPRPGQPETRPVQPGQPPEGRPNNPNPGERIPPFKFRRPDQTLPPGRSGQNPPQIDPRNPRGIDAIPPQGRNPQPGQPPKGKPGQASPPPQPGGKPGQASPPPQPGGKPGQAGPSPQPGGNPGQASPPPQGGNPGKAGPPPQQGGKPGQASPPPQPGSNPGQAGPPPQAGNPGKGGPPPQGGNPGKAGPPPQAGNPGKGGPPQKGGKPGKGR